jgi:hypothetical protein
MQAFILAPGNIKRVIQRSITYSVDCRDALTTLSHGGSSLPLHFLLCIDSPVIFQNPVFSHIRQW